MDIYLAGPMQGYPEFNFPRFNAVTAALRSQGHRVFNPAEKDIERHNGVDISKGNATGDLTQSKVEHKFSLRTALSDDLDYICNTANCIVLLPGWEKSNGAQAEHRTAVALQSEGMTLVYLSEESCAQMELVAQAHVALRENANA
jgi:Domain of unknown function (DUF4406)